MKGVWKNRIRKPLTEEHKRKLSEAHKGIKSPFKGVPRTIETKIKMREAKTGSNFKPNYRVIHLRITSILGKPRECSICGKINLKRFHWANKDHKYTDNPKDWFRACAKCHMDYDVKNNLRKRR